jgi:hypothetical protein
VKTQIIQLEPYDDITSVRDKMGWGQTPRILLVWPVRGRILDRRLDLLFLQRHSASLGGQLALVTKDRDIRYHAKKLGVPVFASVEKAEKSHWQISRLRRGRPSSSRTVRRVKRDRQHVGNLQTEETGELQNDETGGGTSLYDLRKIAHPAPSRFIQHLATRLIFFTMGVLGVLAFAALLVPSAEIRLNPKTQSDYISIIVEASPNLEDITLVGGVPAQWITVIVEGRDVLTTTGQTSIPYRAASGEVIFYNLTDQNVSIPAGTVVSTVGTAPIRFATTRSVTLAGGSDQSAALPIQALSPGVQGNLPAGSITAIEGPLGLSLRVSSPEGTAGGTDITTRAPSPEDYQALHNQLLKALRQTAIEELDTKIEPEDLLLGSGPILGETLEESYLPSEPQPADQLGLTLRYEFRALVVKGEDLYKLGQSVMQTNHSKDYTPIPGTLELSHLSAPILENQEIAQWEMLAEWQEIASLNKTQAVHLTLGLPVPQAIQRLGSNLPLSSPAEITLTPDWWPRLPVLPFRIRIES